MSTQKNKQTRIVQVILLLAGGAVSIIPIHSAWAQAGAQPKRVDVEQLKKQYWNEETQYEVVQNRLYPKSGRMELQLFGGSISSDPFLATTFMGVTLGYHFNEYVSVHALLERDFAKSSSALVRLEETANTTTNTNPTYWTYGGEVVGSLIYGKLSLLGKAILYYDMHILGGAGVTLSETGNYFTQWGGVGQQIYLAKWVAWRIDYRLHHYYEDIRQKIPGQPGYPGQVRESRDNWSHTLNIGLSFFLF